MDLELFSNFSWTALGAIIMADLLLSGDNAIVIALAAKELPPEKRQKAIFIGSGAAILMRVTLTFFAAKLLTFSYLKLIGGILLLWIAIKLLVESDDEEEHVAHHTLWEAVRTILLADLVMSLDNVLAVAAAANGHTGMLIFGLLLSIPLIIIGSEVLLKIMDRFPFIIILGAATLGFISGEMIITDPALQGYFGHAIGEAIKVASVIAVIAIGWYRNGKKLKLWRTLQATT